MQHLQGLFSAAVPLLSLAAPAEATALARVGAKVHTAPEAPSIARAMVLMRDGRITAVGPAEAPVPGRP
ncbi:MAG TPA: hypothetical protein VFL86_27350 [Burkholderiaceae bacterium]|nr:hypothetical protein [Burkholderiaceae bacterium]